MMSLAVTAGQKRTVLYTVNGGFLNQPGQNVTYFSSDPVGDSHCGFET